MFTFRKLEIGGNTNDIYYIEGYIRIGFYILDM